MDKVSIEVAQKNVEIAAKKLAEDLTKEFDIKTFFPTKRTSINAYRIELSEGLYIIVSMHLKDLGYRSIRTGKVTYKIHCWELSNFRSRETVIPEKGIDIKKLIAKLKDIQAQISARKERENREKEISKDAKKVFEEAKELFGVVYETGIINNITVELKQARVPNKVRVSAYLTLEQAKAFKTLLEKDQDETI